MFHRTNSLAEICLAYPLITGYPGQAWASLKSAPKNLVVGILTFIWVSRFTTPHPNHPLTTPNSPICTHNSTSSHLFLKFESALYWWCSFRPSFVYPARCTSPGNVCVCQRGRFGTQPSDYGSRLSCPSRLLGSVALVDGYMYAHACFGGALSIGSCQF